MSSPLRPGLPPVPAKAVSLDGSPGTLVNLGTPFHPGPAASVEAWVNLDPAATIAFHPIVARWDGSYELDVNDGAGKANFVTRNDAADLAIAETADPFTKGAWHHVVGVFHAGQTVVYLDGVPGALVDRSATGSDLADVGDTLFIGSTRDGTQYNWKGLIDEVAFYDHALSPRRIAAHFAAANQYFHRGDANGDDRLDIADGIFLLNYLFLGGRAPGCLESANANDDAHEADIGDSIYIFNYMFLGGSPMPPPGPPGAPCGPDPSPGRGGCKVYRDCGA